MIEKKTKNCIKCNKLISRRAIMCKKCFQKTLKGEGNPMFGISRKGKVSPAYKDGRSSKIYYCIEKGCNNEISYPNFLYGGQRCRKCAFKNPETRLKISLNHADVSGKNHPAYIDGRTPLVQIIRSCFEYKEWRKAIFERDNYTCIECGDNRGGNLNADHIKEFIIIFKQFLEEYNQFSPIEDKETLLKLATKYTPFWDLSNGQTLCEDCHKVKSSYFMKGNKNAST